MPSKVGGLFGSKVSGSMSRKRKNPTNARFGIGEWYGRLLPSLSLDERQQLAAHAQGRGDKPPCPFKPMIDGNPQPCSKKGGVCSLRLYDRGEEPGTAVPASGPGSALRAVCPNRFRQDETVESWVGEVLLGTDRPLAVGEVGFLTSESVSDLSSEPDNPSEEDGDDVGRIDSVLMHPDLESFSWCAVELQAVYFSGPGMGSEFKQAEAYNGEGFPFPNAIRRPDYRSSGPKRLMPQLQIKVPTLRRWGKKMAVVVDEAFFSALGKMDDVPEPSNADIAWFIVRFEEHGATAELQRLRVQFTTLERAVEGLTAGRPVSLPEFERRIRQKLAETQKSPRRPRRTTTYLD
ncbi:hypothetical protein EON81_01820 [bacterium]|nr:MAG: hypothetical protein EON81_01820 [bacterium]